MYPSGADGGLRGWSGGLLTALRTHTQLLWCLASSSIWPQRVVWGAIGRARGGPKPQLGLWGPPLATGMPPWVVVRPNEQKQARVSSVFQLGATWILKLLLDAEFDVEHAGAIGFGAIRLEMTAI